MRKERYITEIKNKSGKSWKVRIRTDEIDVVKTFNEKDYPSAKIAFESAVKFRDKTMYEIVQGNIQKTTGATVQDMFDFAMESYPYSFETKRKHKLLFNKYISHKTKRMQELTRADIVEDLNNMVEEASDNTKKMFRNMCTFYEVPYYEFGSKAELGHALGKEMRASLAIQDEGFSKAIVKLLK